MFGKIHLEMLERLQGPTPSALRFPHTLGECGQPSGLLRKQDAQTIRITNIVGFEDER